MKNAYHLMLLTISCLFCINVVSSQKLSVKAIQELTATYKKIRKPEVTLEKFIELNSHIYANSSGSNAISGPGTAAIADFCRKVSLYCTNGTFESGTLDQNAYSGAYGTTSVGLFPNPFTLTMGFLSGPITSSAARQTIVDTLSGKDPVTGIRLAPLNGDRYALRLGNRVNGLGTEVLAKTVTVLPAETILSFYYAVVFEDPRHEFDEQPAFSVRVYDCANGQELTGVCNLGNNTNIAVSDARNPFFKSLLNNTIAYRDWSLAQINLSQYVGKTVNIVFTNKDCDLSGHYGYTYLDNLFTDDCPVPPLPGDSTGTVGLNIAKTDTCGTGQICIRYRLPKSGITTGSISISLNIYQNNAFVKTITSPLLTTDSAYCFNINPATLGVNTSLGGFDYAVRGDFAINGFSLAPIVIGNPPGGIKPGTNNDYFINCPSNNCLTDVIPPVITPKNTVVSLDSNGNATIQPSDVIQSLFDNCDPVSSLRVTVSPNSFTCANVGGANGDYQAYVSNTSTGNQDFYGELGMEFKVNDPAGIIINQLGTFDHMGDGIVGTQSGGVRVAVFNKVTQTIIPGLDAVITGNADAINANHRLKNITPVTLPPGEYVLIAKGYNLYELNGNAQYPGGDAYIPGDDGAGAISFVNRVLYGENVPNGFTYPIYSNSLASPALLAGTFTFKSGAPATSYQAYVSNTSAGNQDFYGELGHDFRVNDPAGISIKQLGAFDHLGDGITGTQNGGVRVAIFNKATQAIVPGLDAVITGNADAYNANHRLKNISPVTLLPGDYVLVAKGYNLYELNGNSGYPGGNNYAAGDDGSGAISFLNTSSYGDNTPTGFSYPIFSINTTPPAILAGTFTFTKSTTGPLLNSVTITATDTRGNTATATANVIVSDPLKVCNAGPITQFVPVIAQGSKEMVNVQLPVNKGIKSYPNPSNGRFMLEMYDYVGQTVSIQVLNQHGVVLQQKTIRPTAKASNLKEAVDLSAEPDGVYFIKVLQKEKTQMIKIIIRH